MTEAELAEIKARADAATPGPWRFKQGNGTAAWFIRGEKESRLEIHVIVDPGDDARFIASARTDIPKLLDEIERLRWWLERVTHVNGADDAGGGVWHAALIARAGLDGKPIKQGV